MRLLYNSDRNKEIISLAQNIISINYILMSVLFIVYLWLWPHHDATRSWNYDAVNDNRALDVEERQTQHVRNIPYHPYHDYFLEHIKYSLVPLIVNLN